MFYHDISPGIFVGNSSLSDQTFCPSPDKNLSSGAQWIKQLVPLVLILKIVIHPVDS